MSRVRRSCSVEACLSLLDASAWAQYERLPPPAWQVEVGRPGPLWRLRSLDHVPERAGRRASRDGESLGRLGRTGGAEGRPWARAHAPASSRVRSQAGAARASPSCSPLAFFARFPRRRRRIARCRSPTNSRKQRPTSPSVSARPSRCPAAAAAHPPPTHPALSRSSRPPACRTADGDSLSEESKLLLYSLHQQATVVGFRRALAAARPAALQQLAASVGCLRHCYPRPQGTGQLGFTLCGPPHEAVVALAGPLQRAQALGVERGEQCKVAVVEAAGRHGGRWAALLLCCAAKRSACPWPNSISGCLSKPVTCFGSVLCVLYLTWVLALPALTCFTALEAMHLFAPGVA